MERRHFLAAGASLWGASRAWAGANDRIRVAVIGMGGRGNELMRQIAALEGVEVAALCDPDQRRLAKSGSDLVERTGRKAILEPDLRRILDNKEIDAVTIATCNHWHAPAAIWACQAGKHVYVEKPVSHTFREGQKMVEAARKYNRVMQGGTQRRSAGLFRKAIGLLHEGVIGDIYLAKWLFTGPRDAIGFKKQEPPPSWLHWDLWLGPSPEQPYHANLVHYNWHWFWDFGNGELGNNGIHLIDISRWGLNKGLPVRIHSTGGRFGYQDQAETPNTQVCTYEYADGSMLVGEIRGLYSPDPMSWDFYGTKGSMHIASKGDFQVYLGRNKTPEPDMGKLEEVHHYRNFLDAVRAGKPEQLHADIEQTQLSTALCQLGNISFRLGRELRFDPQRQQFAGDEQANALLGREYRKPYVVADQV